MQRKAPDALMLRVLLRCVNGRSAGQIHLCSNGIIYLAHWRLRWNSSCLKQIQTITPLPFETSGVPWLLKASRIKEKKRKREMFCSREFILNACLEMKAVFLTSKESKPAWLLTLWPCIILHNGTLRSTVWGPHWNRSPIRCQNSETLSDLTAGSLTSSGADFLLKNTTKLPQKQHKGEKKQPLPRLNIFGRNKHPFQSLHTNDALKKNQIME